MRVRIANRALLTSRSALTASNNNILVDGALEEIVGIPSFASLELVHSGASLYQSIAPTVIVHSAAVAYSAVFVQTHGYASPDFPEFAFLPTLFCFCNKKESIAIVN